MAREKERISCGPLSQNLETRGRPQKDVKKPSLVTVVFPQVDLQGQKDLLLTLALRKPNHTRFKRGVGGARDESENPHKETHYPLSNKTQTLTSYLGGGESRGGEGRGAQNGQVRCEQLGTQHRAPEAGRIRSPNGETAEKDSRKTRQRHPPPPLVNVLELRQSLRLARGLRADEPPTR